MSRGRTIACYSVGTVSVGPVPALQKLRGGEMEPPLADVIRACCYNILADCYASTEFSQVRPSSGGMRRKGRVYGCLWQ